MNILDALEETGKACVEGKFDEYCATENADGPLEWRRRIDGTFVCHVGLACILHSVWIPYHEEKEIRPEKAGELWEHEKGGSFFVHRAKPDSHILEVTFYYGGREKIQEQEVIHGENGWTRLYPPVENENVERIEVEDVAWRSDGNGPVYVYPIEAGSTFFLNHSNLLRKPRMKMILEIPKDKEVTNGD
jgi:hypothetical protein